MQRPLLLRFNAARCLVNILKNDVSVASMTFNRKQCRYPIRTMKIYTKTGDKGTSALYTGERRSKNDIRFEALGATDELSSAIGMSIAFAEDASHSFVEELIQIQCHLQDIGSFVATPESSARDAHKRNLYFDPLCIEQIEDRIDQMSEELPTLTTFILPSGGKTSSSLHMCRSVCRRAERCLSLVMRTESLDSNVYKYINRLSDYLFTLARYAAMKEKKHEHIYRKHT